MKVAVSLQQILWITKEIEIDNEMINNPQNYQFQLPISPNDKPVVKNIIDVFDEDCNLLFSIGRNEQNKK